MIGTVRVTVNVPARERRLSELLLPGRAGEAKAAIDAAFVTGVLELASLSADSPARPPLEAALATPPDTPLSPELLLGWHRRLVGAAGFRREPWSDPDGRPAAPPELIGSRLELLADWLNAESGRDLNAAPAGAIVLARLFEIRPFAEAHGRVAMLAVRHVMVGWGGRAPVLRGADGPRLLACVGAALRFETAPLVDILEEGTERALEAAIAALEKA